MSLSFGPPSEATRRSFLCSPKKQVKTDVYFLIRVRVNQHFRGGHGVVRCQLLRLGLDLHLTESDVNNVSHRILATPGMFEYFILPSVSTQLLLREGGDRSRSFAAFV